jgi:hypothetical protein
MVGDQGEASQAGRPTGHAIYGVTPAGVEGSARQRRCRAAQRALTTRAISDAIYGLASEMGSTLDVRRSLTLFSSPSRDGRGGFFRGSGW